MGRNHYRTMFARGSTTKIMQPSELIIMSQNNQFIFWQKEVILFSGSIVDKGYKTKKP